MRRTTSLAGQHARWLMGGFVLMQLALTVIFVFMLVLPLAQRAADDLAGLAVLSAQTWAELPPQTRPAFERELREQHRLEIRPSQPYDMQDELHPPFVWLYEAAINRRLATPTHLMRQQRGDEVWYWVNIPTGTRPLSVGWPESRNQTHPFAALSIGWLLSIGLSWWLARWLASRVVKPLAQLNEAMSVVGEGQVPALLSEDGPQELGTVSRRFNAMARQVQELVRARTALVAGVSHDLRTPLTKMRLTLELMRAAPDPLHIERMDREVTRMNRLIGQVLDLARGLQKEPVQTVHVPTLLTVIADDWRDSSMAFSYASPEVEIPVARQAIERALGNLLENARRYAPDGPVELVFESDGQVGCFGVLDRGPGIPAKEIERMKQPFERMEPSRSPLTGGTGLGLAIVHALADANGWQVRMLPREGGGLGVWIDVPLVS